MCFLSGLFCNNSCNRCCRSSLDQNVRMRYVDAGGAENCEGYHDHSQHCGCRNRCNNCDRCSGCY